MGREKQPDIQTGHLGWDPRSTKVDYWRWEKVGGERRQGEREREREKK